MTPEEMMRKIGELETRITELEGKLKVKTDGFEEVTTEKKELETKMSESKDELKKLNGELVKLTEEKVTIKKEAKFSELLKDGKILPAQKDSFMKMELSLSEDFFKDSVKLNLKEQGHGGTPTGDGDGSDKAKSAEDKIEEAALKLMEADKGLSLSDAYSQAMKNDTKLTEEYNAKFSESEIKND